MLILIFGRFVNVAVPFIFANLVFAFEEGATTPPWLYLFGYVGLRFLQGSGGLAALIDVSRTCSFFPFPRVHLNLCTKILWAPVMQYSDSGA